MVQIARVVSGRRSQLDPRRSVNVKSRITGGFDGRFVKKRQLVYINGQASLENSLISLFETRIEIAVLLYSGRIRVLHHRSGGPRYQLIVTVVVISVAVISS